MRKKSNMNIYEDIDLFGDHLGIAPLSEDEIEIDPNMSISDLREEMEDNIESLQESSEEYLDSASKDIDEFLDGLEDEYGKDTKLKKIIPGTDMFEEDIEEEEEEGEKDYENDGHLPAFLDYVNVQYPHNIPKHDGSSILGCERAITFLKKLSDEIRRNIRNDENGDLENSIDDLEKVNTSILADIYTLTSHMKKLDKRLRDANKKQAFSPESSIVKQAGTPSNIVITVTPFIRAITGILVNSVVSAGKPFEEVYDYLCEKYEITEREELEILQVLMDMGQPIFKDRGSLKTKKDLSKEEESLSGVDFLTTYFG